MGFTFENGAFGAVTNVYNIDCSNSPGMVLHLGLGRGSKANGSSPQKKRCPITAQLGSDLLCTSASSCKGSTPPDGFNTEVWGGSDAIFGGNTPVDLSKGATLFYWKKDADERDVPDGYFAAYLQDGILVVHPMVNDDSDGDELISGDDDVGSPQDLLSPPTLTPPGATGDGMGSVSIDDDDD